jgi:hypothetical protein
VIHNFENKLHNSHIPEAERHCSLKEDDVKKVERQVEKSANTILLESRIGEKKLRIKLKRLSTNLNMENYNRTKTAKVELFKTVNR